jgi:hypothetical protein
VLGQLVALGWAAVRGQTAAVALGWAGGVFAWALLRRLASRWRAALERAAAAGQLIALGWAGGFGRAAARLLVALGRAGVFGWALLG